MSIKNPAERVKTLLKKFLEAKKCGETEGYDIALVNPENYEEYYILFKPQTGLYKNQYHILHMKTLYGGNKKYIYPFNAPNVIFMTPVYHTNISEAGSICLDILQNEWVPTYTFAMIIRSILLLFEEPNNSSPFNSTACHDYVTCSKAFKEATKGRKLSLKEEELLREKHFVDFVKKADSVANNNDVIKKFEKWFPQLAGKQRSQEEIEHLDMLFKKFNIVKDKVNKEENKKDKTSEDKKDKEENKEEDKEDKISEDNKERPTTDAPKKKKSLGTPQMPSIHKFLPSETSNKNANKEDLKEDNVKEDNVKDEVAKRQSRWAKYKK